MRALASLAYLEAASVPAFVRLRDELRHARVMTALALRAGSRVSTPTVDHVPLRSLEAIAIENVIEGCVRETHGALVATWQSTRARDLEVRAARWLDRRLDRRSRVRVESARRAAIVELRTSVVLAREDAESRALGLPTPAQALAMIDALFSRETSPAHRTSARRASSRA